MKYPEIQRLMLDGQWNRALVILKRISARYPDDADAMKLEQICRTMSEIQSAAAASKNEMPNIRVSALIISRGKVFLHQLCNFFIRGLSRLPEPWRRKLGYEKWETWEKKFAGQETPDDDLTLSLLLCDPLWRKIIFSIVVGLIVFGLTLIVWNVWPASSEEVDFSNVKFYALHQKAQTGDAQSQYLLGVIFYRGTAEIPRDVEESYYWLSLASKSGHEKAAKLLSKVIFERENKRKIPEQ